MPTHPPRVLVVDEDRNALQLMFMRIEPVFTAVSLGSAQPLGRYLKEIQPDVVVLSDRLKWGHQKAAELVPRIRKECDARVLVLTECIPDGEAARWREWGASGTLLHPTRVETRLARFTEAVMDLAWLGRAGA